VTETRVTVTDLSDALNIVEREVELTAMPEVVRQGRKAQLAILAMLALTVRSQMPPAVKRVSKNPNKLTADERTLACQVDGKIPAIKLVRERCRCGLKEAKDAVDNWMKKNLGFTSHPRPGVQNTCQWSSEIKLTEEDKAEILAVGPSAFADKYATKFGRSWGDLRLAAHQYEDSVTPKSVS
jgi:ribosomal protein L7/L12